MLSRALFPRFITTTATMARPRPRPPRFAPLNPTLSAHSTAPKLAGIVFDVDGTLCEPQTWMFAKMRAALGIAQSVDILEHVYSLAPAAAQDAAMAAVRAVERDAMVQMVPQRGLLALMTYLEQQGVPRAICTRNFDAPVNFLIDSFCPGHVFAPIVTREFRPPKPHPAGILHIAERWGLRDGAARLIMVGDSIDDVAAGRAAGAATVLLRNSVNGELADSELTDCVIDRLDELIGILDGGFGERESERGAAAAP